jgi:hypothetical protein
LVCAQHWGIPFVHCPGIGRPHTLLSKVFWN